MAHSSPSFPDLGEHSGKTLKDRYRLGPCIAHSLRATVYLAEDLTEQRSVAVKLLRLGSPHQPDAFARFKLEIEIVRRLAHPHVVRVYDGDELPGGGPYVVMELLEGETLAARLRRVGRLPVPDAIRIVSQVGAALSAIHRHSIVHRDIRPQKVFLASLPDGSESVKVLDFGLCNVQSGVTFHKLDASSRAYQAPELTRPGVVADHRVDVYALGVMSYEVLTGENPFAGCSSDELGRPRLVAPVAPSKRTAEVPTGVDRVVLRALSLDPSQRDASISRYVSALESAAAGSSTRQRRARGRSTPRAESAASVALQAAKRAFYDGRLDDAVAAAEHIWEQAVVGADPEFQRLVATSFSLLQRIFSERIGSRIDLVGVGPAASELATNAFTAKARELIRLAETRPSAEQLIASSGIPPRDAERMIAGLLRRRALVKL